MAEWKLHPQLAADTILLQDTPEDQLLMMNQRHFPWVILVPKEIDARELIDLPEDKQHALWNRITEISTHVQEMLKPTKLNIAALGNMVEQLHIHIIGRYDTDAAWPKPVWGHEVKPYSDAEIEQIKALWVERLAD